MKSSRWLQGDNKFEAIKGLKHKWERNKIEQKMIKRRGGDRE